MKNWPKSQLTLRGSEDGFEIRQHDIGLPQLCGGEVHDVGPQAIGAWMGPHGIRPGPWLPLYLHGIDPLRIRHHLNLVMPPDPPTALLDPPEPLMNQMKFLPCVWSGQSLVQLLKLRLKLGAISGNHCFLLLFAFPRTTIDPDLLRVPDLIQLQFFLQRGHRSILRVKHAGLFPTDHQIPVPRFVQPSHILLACNPATDDHNGLFGGIHLGELLGKCGGFCHISRIDLGPSHKSASIQDQCQRDQRTVAALLYGNAVPDPGITTADPSRYVLVKPNNVTVHARPNIDIA